MDRNLLTETCMIDLTVRIPLFRAKYIGWLPLEGLIRQRGITFDWELIIAEEINDPEVFGWASIAPYEDRLKAVGCRRIHYIPLEKWIPLGTKISLMVRHADPNSRISVENSADYYSAPDRLARHYEAFKNNRIDQHLPTRAIHYSIGENRAILSNSRYSIRKDAVVGRATRMSLMRQLPSEGPRQGCDRWMWRNFHDICRREKVRFRVLRDQSDTWQHALSCNGFNNLSPIDFPPLRFAHWSLRAYPVEEIRTRIPPDIMTRLEEARIHLPQHRHLGHAPVKKRRLGEKITGRLRRSLTGRRESIPD